MAKEVDQFIIFIRMITLFEKCANTLLFKGIDKHPSGKYIIKSQRNFTRLRNDQQLLCEGDE